MALDKHNMDTQLKEREQLLTAILKSAGEGIIVTDTENKIKYLNSVAETLTGWKQKKAEGKDLEEIFKIIDGKNRTAIRKRVSKIGGKEKAALHGNHITLISRNGKEIPIEKYITPITDDQENISGNVLVFQDITDRAKAGEALKNSELQYRTTIDAMGDLIHTVDRQLRFTLVNNTFTEWARELGLETAVIGRTVFEVFPFLPKKIRQEYRQVFDTGKTLITEETNTVGNREIKTETRKIPIFEGGEIAGVVTVIHDVTKRKQAEARIEHLNAVLRAVRNVNQLITKERDRDKLLKGVCRNLVETRGYYKSWVIVVDESGNYETSAEAGLGISINSIIEKFKKGEPPNCWQKAIRQSGILSIKDSPDFCGDCPLSSGNYEFGTLSVKLNYHGRIYGLLTVYVPVQHIDDTEEQSLFREVADDIAFGLYNIESEEARKRAKKTLHESEENFRSVAENANDGILIADGKGVHVFANNRAAKITGYSVPELLKTKFGDLTHPDEIKRITERFKKRLKQKPLPNQYETWIIRKDGNVIPIELTAARTIWRGQPADIVVIRDITRRRRTEQALRESEERLQMVVYASKDTMIAIGQDGLITLFNPAAEKMFGRTKKEMIGQPLDCLMPEKYHKSHSQYVDGFFRHGKPKAVIGKTIELPAVRKNGSQFSAEVSLSVGRLGKEQFVMAVMRDITERKKAEEALRENEEKFRLISEQSLMAIFILQNEVFKYINQRTSDITGYSIKEMMSWKSRGFGKLIHPEDREFVFEQATRKQTGIKDVVTQYSFRILTKTGEMRWVELFSKTITYRGRNADLVTIIDITERKEAEEKAAEFRERLTQSEKLAYMGKMVAGAAHEINNPLAVLSGMLQEFVRKTDPENPLYQKYYRMRKVSDRIAKTVDGLLQFSRQKKFYLTPTDINELTENSLLLVEEKASFEGIQTKKIYGEDIPKINTEKEKITQVIINLVRNALDAMRDGGVLTISTKYVKKKKQIYIAISDTGHGISPEVKKKLFLPFFTTKDVGRGTGLGLAISYGIIQSHQGDIDVKSTLGKGSTFTIKLPLEIKTFTEDGMLKFAKSESN